LEGGWAVWGSCTEKGRTPPARLLQARLPIPQLPRFPSHNHTPPPAAYLLIPITGVVLGSSNLIGYFKCSKEAKKQLQSMGTNLISAAMQSRLQAAISRV
jgi:hypothetical protein